MTDLLIRGGTILTLGPAGIVDGDVAIADGTIQAVGAAPADADTVVDARGMLVVPGFVQAHVHLCQTLFRGIASGLDVVDWLRAAIWPLEQAHTAETMRAAGRLGIAELLLSGTTCALTMESVHHTDHVFAAAEELGIRATIGKALMDRREPGTEMLGEATDDALADLDHLIDRWHGAAGGRLRAAVSPRAPRSGTTDLWHACVRLADDAGLVLHTHVNENRAQADRCAVPDEGRDVHALDQWGALGPRLVMAHAVWLDDHERDLIRRRRPHICHCPSANLKLASGLAPIPELVDDGINIALGADGAACNDRLDIFTEMRLAALIHHPRRGPRAVTAEQAIRMATTGGAHALGLADQIGTIEPGKAADIVLIRRDRPHLVPHFRADPYQQIVYAATTADVQTVVVAGHVVVRDATLQTADTAEILSEADTATADLLATAGLSNRPGPVQ